MIGWSRFKLWLWRLCCVTNTTLDTLLSQCLSPPRCVNVCVCVCVYVYFIGHSPLGLSGTNANIQTNLTRLRIPTGGRQTSWLFTSVAKKLNSGLPRTTSASGQNGYEPTTYGFQIRRSNHSATLPPINEYG